MSTLGALLTTVIVMGMLLAYYVGYAVGRREGLQRGRKDGKREGAARAFAVGYDRGRHDRKEKHSDEDDDDKRQPGAVSWGCFVWLLPVVLSLLAVIVAAVYESYKNGR